MELLNLIKKLSLEQKEGFSSEEYISCLQRRPLDEAAYYSAAAGIPARKVTLKTRTAETGSCAELLDFIDDLVVYLVHQDTEFIYEFGEDLQASMYLAIAGHYRQACALLRFALENALHDSYFELHEGYDKWMVGELYLQTGRQLVDSVFTKQYRINSRLKSHIKELSQYVHFKSKLHANPNVLIAYNDDYFERWHKLFIETCILIAQVLLAYRFTKAHGRQPNWQLITAATGLEKDQLINEIWAE